MTEFEIRALGRQGDGIAEGPVFVPRALPGEIVSGTLQGDRLTDLRVLEPVSERVTPPCKHFKTCGGCQMQHASDMLVANWKREIVETVLAVVGLKPLIRSVQTSPTHSRRRATFSARRTKSGAMAGFHGRASGSIVDVQVCPLITAGLAKGLDVARALAVAGASRKTEMSVQCTEVAGGLDVVVTGGKPLDHQLETVLPSIALDNGIVRLIWDGALVAQSEPPLHRIGKANVMLPPGAFLQATAHGELALQDAVLAATQGAFHMADLFAGCGTFALRLAERGPVMAVEGDKPMTRALQDAANHGGLTHPIKALTRDLFNDPLMVAELAKFDGVVLDPPRAGASAQVTELANSTVPVISYVSCDPASFARDAKILTDGGYVLDWVQVVDQFRWSPHTELAARFHRPHMQRGTS